MAEPNIQQELLRLFQQQQQPVTPQLNTGLLAPDQQGIGDVFRNPDQAQVNALVGGLAGLANPRGRDPALMAVAQGAQAFQNTRMQDYQRRVEGEKLRQENLKNQLQGALGIAKFGQAEQKHNFSVEKDERAQVQQELTNRINKEKAKRTEGVRTQVNVAIPKEGGGMTTTAVQRDTQGNFYDIQGNPVQLPVGTRIATTGKTEEDIKAGGFGLTTAQEGKTQERILRAQKKMRALTKMTTDSFNKFLSTKGRAVTKIGTILDFASGMGGESMADFAKSFSGVDPVAFAAESRVMFEDLEAFFNEHRKDITGAAAAFVELEQIRKSVLNGELPPAQAAASLASLMQKVNENLEADFQALESGVQPTTSKADIIKSIKQQLSQL